MTFDLQMLLHLIGCGCSQSGTLRTAGLWVLCSGSRGWLGVLNCNQLKTSCCCWRVALHQPGTGGHLICLGVGCGERPASPAAGRTEELCSCTSCCRDAPCLCCSYAWCGRAGGAAGPAVSTAAEQSIPTGWCDVWERRWWCPACSALPRCLG